MDDAAGVGIIEGTQNEHAVPSRVVDGHGALGGEAAFDGPAFHELHEHEQLVVGAHRGMEASDVRVFEAGLDLDFAQEPVGEFGILGEVG